jgi:hypothetical protein
VICNNKRLIELTNRREKSKSGKRVQNVSAAAATEERKNSPDYGKCFENDSDNHADYNSLK